MARPTFTEDGKPIRGGNGDVTPEALAQIYGYANRSKEASEAFNAQAMDTVHDVGSAMESVADELQNKGEELTDTVSDLTDTIKDAGESLANTLNSVARQLSNAEISLKNTVSANSEVLKNTRNYARTVREANDAEKSKKRNEAAGYDTEYSKERVKTQKLRSDRIIKQEERAEKNEQRREEKHEAWRKDQEKKEQKEKKAAIKEEAENRKNMLKDVFRSILRVIKIIGGVAIATFKFGSSFGMQQNEVYNTSGGGIRRQAQKIKNAWAQFKEGLKDMAANSKLFKHDAEVFKSGMEIYSETLAEYLGITEMTVAQAIKNLEGIFRSVGLGGQDGVANNSFATDLTENNAEAIATLIGAIVHAQGGDDELTKQAYENIANIIASGSGYDPITGVTLDKDIRTAHLQDMFGGEYMWTEQLSEQNDMINSYTAIYDQLKSIDSILGQGLSMEDAERANRKYIASMKEVGQVINAAKQNLYEFDEVISASKDRVNFTADEQDLYDRGVRVNKDGTISTYSIEEEANRMRLLVEDQAKWTNATAGIKDSKELIVNITPLIAAATGMTEEETTDILTDLFNKVPFTRAVELAWQIYWESDSGAYKWTYNELKETLNSESFSADYTLTFHDNLSDLETAKAAYATLIGVSISTLNDAIEAGNKDALKRINEATAEFLQKSNKDIINTYYNVFKFIEEAVKLETEKAQDLVDKLNEALGLSSEFNSYNGLHINKDLTGGTYNGYNFKNKLNESQTELVMGLYRKGDLTPENVYRLMNYGMTEEQYNNWVTWDIADQISEHPLLVSTGLTAMTAGAALGGPAGWATLGAGGALVGQYFAPRKKPIKKAVGGIAIGPTNSIIGEAGAEAVIPLQTENGVDYLAKALQEAGANNTIEVHVTLNGQILEMNDYNVNRLGQKLGAIIDNANNRRGSQNYAVNKQ